MTAVLHGERQGDIPDDQPVTAQCLDFDPLNSYNQIADSGLVYFDTLKSMHPALYSGAHTLAYFPFGGTGPAWSPDLNRKVEHARESFLIGLAIRTGSLHDLESMVNGLVELTPEEPNRELLLFGGRVILEQAYFDGDVVRIDGDPEATTSVHRTISGTGSLTGVSYEIAPAEF